MIAERPASFDILGCRVDAVGGDDAVARIVAATEGAQSLRVITLGVEMVMYACRDARFRETIATFELSLCDTIGILLASRLRGGPLRERVTGVGLIEALARRSAERGDIRLYLMGAAPGIAERAAARLKAQHPGIRIAGVRDGYFSAAESDGVAAAIAATGANVLLAGLGSPKQEFWLERYLSATQCRVGIGVGGSFDVIAGTKRRAPRAMQRLGLEWFFRLVQEPSRWRRQLALPQFVLAATVEAFSRKGSMKR
jgi:N-acetylglucosaminyldiphosphoundecaprenol N-acetyl-beta-D-mannosaminyltransferase